MYKSSITTLAALSVGVLLVSLSGERTAPTGARDSLEPARSATTASSLVLDAARIEVHGRASIDADLDPAPRRSELLAQLGDACEGRDLEALEVIISAWLERSPDPVGGALELLDGLAEREPEAEGVGLLLQGCMLLATSHRRDVISMYNDANGTAANPIGRALTALLTPASRPTAHTDASEPR